MAAKMEDIDLIRSRRTLNTTFLSTKKSIPGVELAERLRKSLLNLKSKFISANGKIVDYEQLKQSRDFQDYTKDAVDLQIVDVIKMSDIEKKAFFINIYNCLTLHGLIEQPKLPESVLQVQQFFKTTSYTIAGLVFSLDDIEHGILRCNRPHPSSTKPTFSPDDPKLKFICKTFDPRIHFALVCGAKSCPAISVYSVDNLDAALDKATRNFCSQEVFISNEKNEIFISKLFQWYRSDFGVTDIDVLKWILPFLSQTEHDRYNMLIMKLEMVGSVAVKYLDYNWSLNIS
ncbi:hypothetical protein Bpfe_002315 [Biomphalaria pfeifferi]|uniref:DUF547 domain-containing protein n=1 Tax=Biomphalaria pfeifferi TaxID=112525 RepID=A0AAD8C8K9_BIOPF|nr:hypothetical protein Bpfe_002315 [Biomphalaria pfeifferi]